jgi:BirA family biotin operon repressor/biotin-[acetyl-CoA-carboxylase] ligase
MAGLSRDGRILRLLLGAQGYLSGERVGEELGVSRAAVGKAVDGLRDLGFVIEARSHQGYRLLSEPDAVLPCRVEARREQAVLGQPLVHFTSIDSTNLEARRRAEGHAPSGLCLVAEHQSAGRGRLDRRWSAPPGTCLLFSLLLRPPLPPSEVFALTNLAALAVCRAVEGMGVLRPAIKWPNDVFLDGRKLAGILTEFACRAESLDHVVLGVGLNVNLTPAQLAKLPAPAASLRAASGRKWDRAALLATILDQLSHLYAALLSGEKPALAAEYNARSFLQGKQVQVRDGEKVLLGRALEVASDGALTLALDDGSRVVIRHGDVSVLGISD